MQVEDRPAQADALERKRRDHLVQREDFAFVGHRPSHQRQEVEQRLGQIPLTFVVAQRHRVLALADLAAVGVAQQRHVHEHRRRPAERLVQHEVLGGRGNPLLGADDVRDLHDVIVHHVGQVIGGIAVGLEQHLIVDLPVLDGDGVAKRVVHHGAAIHRHLQAHHRRLVAVGLRPRVGKLPAVPVVTQRGLVLPLLLAHRFQAFRRAPAAIRRAAVEQLLHVLAVDGQTLRLPVGAVGAANVRPLVPRQADPAQGAQDVFLVAPFGARLIGVLDANDAAPVVHAGKHDVEQPDIGGAHVRRAGRAGRDADAHL